MSKKPCDRVRSGSADADHVLGLAILAAPRPVLRWITVFVLSGVFSSIFPAVARAGAMDWLRGKQGKNVKVEAERDTPTPVVNLLSADHDKGSVPDFFRVDEGLDRTGKGLPIMKFAEVHWEQSKRLLEESVRLTTAKMNDRRGSEILRKLCVVNLQLLRVSLKEEAQGLATLEAGNHNLQTLLDELNRIITAPRQETMENLENGIAKVEAANREQLQIAQRGLQTAEELIEIGKEGYQTLELIPSLSLPCFDLFVGASKRMMKQIQSANEAWKGFLLNMLNADEQVAIGLETARTTVKTTLKYSDHFAFRQFPLINLPVPSREKLFRQVGQLRNLIKGNDNTVVIGDSHLRNAAQQMSHLFQAMQGKVKDSLKYEAQVDMTSGNLPQISLYALNQVSGLFQRVKEQLAALSRDTRQQATTAAALPKIAMESAAENQMRKSREAAQQQLPLFLLGGRRQEIARSSVPVRVPAKQPAPLIAPENSGFSGHSGQGGQNETLGRSGRGGGRGSDSGGSGHTLDFRQEELDLLGKEFGDSLARYLPVFNVPSTGETSALRSNGGSIDGRPGDDNDEFILPPEDESDSYGDAFVNDATGLEDFSVALTSERLPPPRILQDEPMELLRLEPMGEHTGRSSELLPLLRLDPEY